ncbi:MAG: hypothetical protein RMN52_10565, partial [Anaerolineae bacterium]|nr:hypothetical protein [Candidatus Roseilinea sp.]MDW8450437.1 hypothetical protein [Anaerolineae bacterium]
MARCAPIVHHPPAECVILGARRWAFAVARITIDYTSAIHQDAGIARLTREIVRAVLASGAPHEFSLFVMGRPAPGVPLSNLM